MKKVLMVAFHYPPLFGSSGIHRTLSFARYLPDYGWQPIVLTAHPAAYPQIENDHRREIVSHVVVERAFGLDTARHLSIAGFYLRWLALPDRWVSWWLGAVPVGLRLIRKYQPQVIWSTYPVATAHLIGLTLHGLTGIPWVADFRDPMTEKDPVTGIEYPLDAAVRRANGWVERPTVKRCTRAVFTTPGTLCMYAERYPGIPPSRWALIANGYDEEDFLAAESAINKRSSPTSCVVLIHSGVLYPSARNPRAFFAALAELRQAGKISPSNLKIILRASGYDDYYRQQVRENGIDGIVFLEPPVSYREALAEMVGADGLLIFQASNCNWQIPAKVYEYLRARCPIFAMTDPQGDTAGVLKTAGIHTIVPLDSKEQIAEEFLEFLIQVREGRAPIPGHRDVKRHSRHFRTEELARQLDSFVEG